MPFLISLTCLRIFIGRFAVDNNKVDLSKPVDVVYNNKDATLISITNGLEGNNNNSKYSKFVGRILDTLNREIPVGVGNVVSYEGVQVRIEDIVINLYDKLFSEKQFIIDDVNMNALSIPLKEFIFHRLNDVEHYVDNLKAYCSNNKSRLIKKQFTNEIITTLDKNFLINTCLILFLTVFTYHESKKEEKYVLTNIGTNIGKKIVLRYYIKKMSYTKETKEKISFSKWLEIWESENSKFKDILDDSLHLELGARIVEVLENCDMLWKTLEPLESHRFEKHYVLKMVHDDFLSLDKKSNPLK